MSALPDPYDPHEPAHPPDEDDDGPSESPPPDTLDAAARDRITAGMAAANACEKRGRDCGPVRRLVCGLYRCASCARPAESCEGSEPVPLLSDPYPWDALERAALDLATAADAAHDEEQLEPDPAELEDEPDTSPDEVDPWLLIF